MKYLPDPIGKHLRNGDYILTKKYVIKTEHFVFTLPKGFKSDGASIPWFVQWFGDPYDGDTLPGALVHDALYKTKGRYSFNGDHFRASRRHVDEMFLALMEANGVFFLKRAMYFIMVRAFGIFPWLFGKLKSDIILTITYK